MAKYEYSLSGRDFISDERAKRMIDEAANVGLLRGDIINASWCDLTETGDIFVSLRNISLRIRFKELLRDEFIGWIKIITSTSCSTESEGQSFYMMLLGFDEIDAEVQPSLFV